MLAPVRRFLAVLPLFVVLCGLNGCRAAPKLSEAAQASGVQWISIPGAGYSLAKTEITIGQYQRCVEDGGCASYKLEGIEWKERPWATDEKCLWQHRNSLPERPINCLDWHQADDFCRWVGGRLPTKKEWQAEASGGGSRIYPWGDANPTCELAVMDDWQNTGGFADRGGCGTQAPMDVCSKPKGNSLHGLCDMAGNLTEWTSTQELEETPPRYHMGGNYSNSATFLEARFELINPTGVRLESLGARCLKPQ